MPKEEIVVEQTEVVAAESTNTEVAEVEKKSAMLSTNAFENMNTLKDYFTMGKYLAQSDLVPDCYRNKPMNCVIALEQAQRMNVSPLFVMQNLYIVKNKPVWSGSACSMLVKGCGLFDDVKLNYVGEKGKETYGAYVSAIDKKTGETLIGTTVDMSMAKRFGWDKTPMWVAMPEQMLGYRAYSFFARLHCPNALNGFATEGEVQDIEAGNKHSVDNPF